MRVRCPRCGSRYPYALRLHELWDEEVCVDCWNEFEGENDTEKSP